MQPRSGAISTALALTRVDDSSLGFGRAAIGHMTLNPDSVTALSREIARQVDPRFEVLGVTSIDGGSDRVELLVTLKGCHREPCTVMVNVSRADQQQLRETLHQALANHRNN